MTFSPTAPGPTSGFLDVLIDGGPTLLYVNLNGDGMVPGTAASVSPSPAFFPTTLVGSSQLHVELHDPVPGSNNGAGVEKVFLQLSSGAGVFHATGSAASPVVIQVGAIGNSDTWIQ